MIFSYKFDLWIILIFLHLLKFQVLHNLHLFIIEFFFLELKNFFSCFLCKNIFIMSMRIQIVKTTIVSTSVRRKINQSSTKNIT